VVVVVAAAAAVAAAVVVVAAVGVDAGRTEIAQAVAAEDICSEHQVGHKNTHVHEAAMIVVDIASLEVMERQQYSAAAAANLGLMAAVAVAVAVAVVAH